MFLSSFEKLYGPGLLGFVPTVRWAKSPIASVQRTRSTLASHSAVPRETNVKRSNERQSRDPNRSTTNARSASTNFSVFWGEI